MPSSGTRPQQRIAHKLRELMQGKVLADLKIRQRYARDQSIYEIRPAVVAFPEDSADVQRLVAFAAQEGLPITPRGGGSGLAGSALGEGLVVALPQNEFWGRISGFAAERDRALVSAGAGVYHQELQKFLREQGFFLPADVTSAAISCLGGNIATKASGPHALKFGSIDRFLTQVEFVTAQGELVDTAREATIPARFREKLDDLERRINADEAARGVLEARRGLKTASGYNLFAFLDELPLGERLAQLLVGSVGTLGLVTRATLRGERYEPERAAVLLYFAELAETGRAVCRLRELDVAAIELISRETVRLLRERTTLPASLVTDANLLLVELSGPACREGIDKINTLLERSGLHLAAPLVAATSGEELENLWELRRQILWLIQHPQPSLRALAVVNDVGVPPEQLAGFIADVQQVMAEHHLVTLIYGHAGNGNLHLRPLFDVTRPDLKGRIRRLADDVYETVFRHGGTVTAEHGMGRLRAPYLRREWGAALYDYMREVKDIFDPQGLFNPGVMFNEAPITDHLRPDLLKP